MEKTVIDTLVTTSTYQNNLQELDTYMAQVNSNIANFNQHIKQNLTGLKSRSETTEDLMINVFKGNKVANNSVCVDYITRKEEEYEDGAALTPELLMNKALNKYSTQKSKLVWGAHTPERQDIVALIATVQQLKDQNL
eukprot:14156164-Ditylum_brightwellii.AAC.1